MQPYVLLAATTATGPGPGVPVSAANKTVQASVTGPGAVSATVPIEVSNDGTNWLPYATITLSGNLAATDGFPTNDAWVYWRANPGAINGTLNVTMGG